MADSRRGFLALVGGSLLSGSVLSRPTAAAPTLILPPKLDLTPTRYRPKYPILDRYKSRMDAILHITETVDPAGLDIWLACGAGLARAIERGEC